MLMIQPPPRCFSAGNRGLRAQEHAGQVGGDEAVPVVGLHVGHVHERADAGVVDERVHAAEPFRGGPDEGLGHRRVRHVTLHGRHAGAEFGHDRVEVGLRPAGDHDPGPAGHEAARDGQADAPGSPGDDGDVSAELRLGSHAPYTSGVARRLPRPSFMPFVAILGAGPLGGALAHALASRGRFDEVRLIDPEKTLAAGKALDILQAGPVDASSTRVTGSASLDAAHGAWVTLLADPIQPDPLDSSGGTAPALTGRHGRLRRCRSCPRPRASGGQGPIPPDRLVGAAPAAAASAARALLALDTDRSPSQVHVGISDGGAPGTCAIDWARTAIEGVPAASCLRREQQQRLDARLAALWPPGPLTLAAAATRVAEAAWFGARPSFPCWWVTDGGAGAPSVRLLRFAPGGRARVIS